MKFFRIALVAAAPYLPSACQSGPTSSATPIAPVAAGGLQRLEGTWVGHEKGSFTLVKIKADSTGSYTTFIDNEKESGQPDPTDPYFLYESNITVKYRPDGMLQPRVAIHTDNFRFDYYLSGDTLIEYDKMGRQGTLVRVQPDKH